MEFLSEQYITHREDIIVRKNICMLLCCFLMFGASIATADELNHKSVAFSIAGTWLCTGSGTLDGVSFTDDAMVIIKTSGDVGNETITELTRAGAFKQNGSVVDTYYWSANPNITYNGTFTMNYSNGSVEVYTQSDSNTMTFTMNSAPSSSHTLSGNYTATKKTGVASSSIAGVWNITGSGSYGSLPFTDAGTITIETNTSTSGSRGNEIVTSYTRQGTRTNSSTGQSESYSYPAIHPNVVFNGECLISYTDGGERDKIIQNNETNLTILVYGESSSDGEAIYEVASATKSVSPTVSPTVAPTTAPTSSPSVSPSSSSSSSGCFVSAFSPMLLLFAAPLLLRKK